MSVAKENMDPGEVSDDGHQHVTVDHTPFVDREASVASSRTMDFSPALESRSDRAASEASSRTMGFSPAPECSTAGDNVRNVFFLDLRNRPATSEAEAPLAALATNVRLSTMYINSQVDEFVQNNLHLVSGHNPISPLDIASYKAKMTSIMFTKLPWVKSLPCSDMNLFAVNDNLHTNLLSALTGGLDQSDEIKGKFQDLFRNIHDAIINVVHGGKTVRYFLCFTDYKNHDGSWHAVFRTLWLEVVKTNGSFWTSPIDICQCTRMDLYFHNALFSEISVCPEAFEALLRNGTASS
ncbi:hypothetical protein V8F20_009047 [Naviculisporaceae sp. PSN 640]